MNFELTTMLIQEETHELAKILIQAQGMTVKHYLYKCWGIRKLTRLEELYKIKVFNFSNGCFIYRGILVPKNKHLFKYFCVPGSVLKLSLPNFKNFDVDYFKSLSNNNCEIQVLTNDRAESKYKGRYCKLIKYFIRDRYRPYRVEGFDFRNGRFENKETRKDILYSKVTVLSDFELAFTFSSEYRFKNGEIKIEPLTVIYKVTKNVKDNSSTAVEP